MERSLEYLIGFVFIVVVVYFIVRNNRRKRDARNQRTQQLIALQNVVSNTKSDRLTLSAAQLNRAVINYVSRMNGEMTKSVESLNSADNPKAFFANLEKVYGVIDKLQAIYDVMPEAISPSPSEMRATVDRTLGEEINAMIDRAWTDAQLSAAKYVKDATKAEKYRVFFDSMDVYSGKMRPENHQHLQELRSSVGI